MTELKEDVNPGGALIEPLLTRPEKVAIVCLGRSNADFVQELIQNSAQKKAIFDEVWTVNRGLRAIAHDKVFCMDDLMWIKERDRNYYDWLKAHDKPVITSTPYPEVPNSVAYPLQDVSEYIKDDIFTVNTVAYMVAYAMTIGVETLSIYGADFFYPDGNKAEEGGQAVAYLLGMAAGMGMVYEEHKMPFISTHHRVPQSSTLLYAYKVQATPAGPRRPPYGYHRQSDVEYKKTREAAKKKAKKGKKNG